MTTFIIAFTSFSSLLAMNSSKSTGTRVKFKHSAINNTNQTFWVETVTLKIDPVLFGREKL